MYKAFIHTDEMRQWEVTINTAIPYMVPLMEIGTSESILNSRIDICKDFFGIIYTHHLIDGECEFGQEVVELTRKYDWEKINALYLAFKGYLKYQNYSENFKNSWIKAGDEIAALLKPFNT